MITTIVFNGPPNSGKDALGGSVCQAVNGQHLQFKDVLYEETAKRYEVDLGVLKNLATDRETKELPTNYLLALHDSCPISPRDALIETSEYYVKPTYGKAYFGLHTALKLTHGFNIITDSGFDDELLPIIANSDLVIGVRLSCDECTFKGDSRKYLDWRKYAHFFDNVKFVEFENCKMNGIEGSALNLMGKLLGEACV